MRLLRHARSVRWKGLWACGPVTTTIKIDSSSFATALWLSDAEDFQSRDSLLGHPQLPHLTLPTQTIEPLWLKHQNRPRWMNSRLATLDPSLQGRMSHQQWSCTVGPSTPGDQIRSLCEEGQVDKAVETLLQMEQENSAPSLSDYATILKACTKSKALSQARRVRASMAERGLDSNGFLGEYMVSTLAKCGSLEDAIGLFNRLPYRTALSWTAVICGSTVAGNCQEAVRLFHCMQEEGLPPNKCTLISLLKACGHIFDLEVGKQLHAAAVQSSWESDLIVGTCLVDMYAKCGSFLDAQKIFNNMPQRDTVVWNTMLAGCLQNGLPETCLQLYEQLQEEGVSPSVGTFVNVIQACGMLAEVEDAACRRNPRKPRALEKGKMLHQHASRKGYGSDAFVASSLVNMYGKCRSLVDADSVFDGMFHRDVVLWNSVLAAYAQQGYAEKVFKLFDQMQDEGVSADGRTLVTLVQALNLLIDEERDGSIDKRSLQAKLLEKGKVIQTEAQRKGLESNVFLGSALITMYGKYGNVTDAWVVFERLSQPNVVPWNAIIAACSQNGLEDKALQLYEQMGKEGVQPNSLTFVTALQACGMLGEANDLANRDHSNVDVVKRGKAVHADAWAQGFKSDVIVGSTLISMYGKCGSIEDAVNVFDGLSQRDVVAWTAMLAAYARQGEVQKALELYRQMQDEGLSPDDCTLVCILQMSGNTGGLEICRQIHHKLVSSTKHNNPVLVSNLIHAYGKCSSMVDAQNVFDSVQQHDVVSWTALIAAYARQGCWLATTHYYQKMQEAGIEPNGVTFLSLLSACSHAGLVANGIKYFESMSIDYGITPGIEHYATMVDLLGRAGYFTLLQELLSTMPMRPNFTIWLCLLGACRKHGIVQLGKQAFDHAVHFQPENATVYLLMSNIYADAGYWNSSNQVKELGQQQGCWRKPGQSWMEFEEQVYVFLPGESNDRQLVTLCNRVT